MSSSNAAVADVAGSYRVCDTVVLFCLAFACGVIVLALAVCFRRMFAQAGYASGGAAAASSVAAGRRSSRRGGLSPSELGAIPKSMYRRGVGAGAGAGGWAQCAICLAVVSDGEVVRRLPACGHMFHVECIDTWLYSHPTCPICRCDVGRAATVAGDKV